MPADDELDGEAFRPSAAFCRALDNEQEYDSIDAVAMAGDHEEALSGLASTTEVCTRSGSLWLHKMPLDCLHICCSAQALHSRAPVSLCGPREVG